MTAIMNHVNEVERIREEYSRRARELPDDYYSLVKPVNLYFYFQRQRLMLPWMNSEGFYPKSGMKICEVGCGAGDWLLDFIRLGILPCDTYGIDLDEERVKTAKTKIPEGDIRLGDASRLPWGDDYFDIVLQATMFTSILDEGMKREVADEMVRILKPDGVIVWYDFRLDNPRNKNVKGIGRAEIRRLFAICRIKIKPLTLAPPLARRIVPFSWILAELLEKLVFLRTHYLALIMK